MRPFALATLLLGLGCEQYHPTAPDHIRPASERDQIFAAKVGDEAKRRVINSVEDRAGPAIEPWLDEHPEIQASRLSFAGPVAIIEGTRDGRIFAGVYWVRGDQIIRRREFLGPEGVTPPPFTGSRRSRGPGDASQIELARAVVSGKRDTPRNVKFFDRDVEGGPVAMDEQIRGGKRVEDGWSVGRLAVVMTADGELWVFQFEREKMAEARRYTSG